MIEAQGWALGLSRGRGKATVADGIRPGVPAGSGADILVMMKD